LTTLNEVQICDAFQNTYGGQSRHDTFLQETIELGAWIRLLATRGLPLKKLIFKGCHPKLKSIADKIHMDGTVDQIVWTAGAGLD
jgi:hypothetical protein